MKTLYKIILTTAITVQPILGFGQDSPHSFSANVNMATDYLFRGQSQTDNGPAIQGGVDYAHELGFYAGVWASNISFADNIEWGIYGGYAGELSNGLSYDLLALYYRYPATTDTNAGEDYFEIGPSLGYTFKGDLEPSVTAGFMWSDDFSLNSGTGIYVYGDLGLSLPNDFGLGLHIGSQSIKDEAAWGTPDWIEYNVSLSRSFMGLGFTVTFSDTNLSEAECFGGGNVCDSTVVFSVSAGF